MRLRTRLVAGSLSLLALGVASARLFAEDLDLAKLLDGAKAACAEKRYGQALQDLQLVVGEVGRLRMEGLKALLPAAPAGWTAEAAEGTANAAMLGMGTTVRRSYRKGDAVTASMELVADASILLSGLQMMLANPALIGGNNQIVTVKGRRALLEFDAAEKRGTLQMMLGGSASLLKIEGSGLSKADLVDVLAGAVDLDAMEKAIQK